MPDKFEISVTSKSDDSVPSDNEMQKAEQNRLDRMERRIAAAERSARAEERAIRAAKRAENRERDRQADRAARNARKERAERDRQDVREKRFLQEKETEQEKANRSAIAGEKKLQTQRRRFINDMLGSLNHAHLGRRINHGIDFIRSIAGVAPSATVGDVASSIANNTNTSNNSNSNSVANNNTSSIRNFFSSILSGEEIVDASIVGKKKGGDITLDAVLAGTKAKTATGAAGGPITVGAAAAGGTSSIGGIAGGAGGSGGVGGFGGAAAGGASGGAAIAGGLAVLGGLIAIVGTVYTTKKAFDILNDRAGKLADSLSNVPSALIFANMENDLLAFQNNLRRANEYGGDLADIEREFGKQRLLSEDIGDAITGPLLPLTREANRLLTNIAEPVTALFEIFSSVGIKSAVDKLTVILQVLNAILDTGEKTREMFLSFIGTFSPSLKKALSKFLKPDSQLSKDQENTLAKQLFEFMMFDVSKDGQINDETEFNFGF